MFIVKKMIVALMESFPVETKEALKSLVNEEI